MHTLLRYVGSAAVASALAVFLTVFVFRMPLGSAVETGLIAGAVAVVIVYLNTRQRDAAATTPRNQR